MNSIKCSAEVVESTGDNSPVLVLTQSNVVVVFATKEFSKNFQDFFLKSCPFCVSRILAQEFAVFFKLSLIHI